MQTEAIGENADKIVQILTKTQAIRRLFQEEVCFSLADADSRRLDSHCKVSVLSACHHTHQQTRPED